MYTIEAQHEPNKDIIKPYILEPRGLLEKRGYQFQHFLHEGNGKYEEERYNIPHITSLSEIHP